MTDVKIPSQLNFIDVFAGAGGLSCGLEMAGHHCLLGIDIDRHAMNTFAKNHPKAQVYSDDIQKLTQKKLQELLGGKNIHAIVGGPPCQGFSTVGRGDPLDTRNSLFLQFVRLVKMAMPYYVVIENVTGLLAKKNEKTLQSIFKRFKNLGFKMDVRVMSAQEHGVPETRRRTILLGSRVNDEIIFPKASHDRQVGRSYIPPITVGESLKNLQDSKGNINNHDIELAQVKTLTDLKRLKHIPEGRGIRYEKDEQEILPKNLRLGVNWSEIPEQRFRQCKYQRLHRDKPSPTIMTHRHNYYHPTEHRYLTQREAASLQSFPNDFIFTGPVSAQWRQIGNAVPPLLGKAIGKALKSMVKQANLQLELEFETDKKKKIKKVPQSEIHMIRKSAFSY